MDADGDATTRNSPGGPGSAAVTRFVEGYLATLEGASPSTRRQRSWALHELGAHAGPTGVARSPAGLLAPDHVRSWLDAAATADPPASLPGLRARASAARALAHHGEGTSGAGGSSGVLPPGTADALAPVLRMPAPPLAPGPDPHPVRRLLVAAHPDNRPLAVHPAVWTRFCAHVHLLALTGEREDVMATLPLACVTTTDLTPAPTSHLPPRPVPEAEKPGGTGGRGTGDARDAGDDAHVDGDSVTPSLLAGLADAATGAGAAETAATTDHAAERWESLREELAPRLDPATGGHVVVATHLHLQHASLRPPGEESGAGFTGPRSWRLPEPARVAVAGWLRDRSVLASLLRGSPPQAMWLRVRPSTDLRTGALRPAGLPVSDRGLRMAYVATLEVLALGDASLADLSTAAVRAYARGRGPAT